MRTEATILHADLDSFYASVEQRDDPSLRGRPVLVGGGVVLAASYEAKAYGVKGAMGGRQAAQLCPHAITVPPRFKAYTEASKAVFAIFEDTTPLVEGLSIDEAFLDVGGLKRVSGPAVAIAERLRRRVREEVGLPITVGVACTKFLAKVASAVAKPDGLLVVEPGGELAFLHPLPVERLWGVGEKTAVKLRARGIETVAEVARLEEATLVAMLGRASGRHLHALAHNRDPRPVVVGRRRGSIGSQCALGGGHLSPVRAADGPGGDDPALEGPPPRRQGPKETGIRLAGGRRRRTPQDIDAVAVAIVDRVTRRMRAAGRVGRTVVLRLRFGDFTRATRSQTLVMPTSHTETILATVRDLLAAAQPLIEEQGLTLVGVAVANLSNDDAVQLPLPFDRRSGTGIDSALDLVRERFGTSAVTRAVLLGRDTGYTVPMLPD